ncbi:hypothetical protein Tco_0572955 [Tanacetum coccineum]
MEISTVIEEQDPTWMTPIVEFINTGTLPHEQKDARRIHRTAQRFELREGVLYRRSFLQPWLRFEESLLGPRGLRRIVLMAASHAEDTGKWDQSGKDPTWFRKTWERSVQAGDMDGLSCPHVDSLQSQSAIFSECLLVATISGTLSERGEVAAPKPHKIAFLHTFSSLPPYGIGSKILQRVLILKCERIQDVTRTGKRLVPVVAHVRL